MVTGQINFMSKKELFWLVFQLIRIFTIVISGASCLEKFESRASSINAGPSHFHLSDDDEICFHGKTIKSILDPNFAQIIPKSHGLAFACFHGYVNTKKVFEFTHGAQISDKTSLNVMNDLDTSLTHLNAVCSNGYGIVLWSDFNNLSIAF